VFCSWACKTGSWLVLTLDQDEPFFWLADTAWELFHRLDEAEAKLYLDKRAAQGFNVVFVVVLWVIMYGAFG
jgi:hypothetical protein